MKCLGFCVHKSKAYKTTLLHGQKTFGVALGVNLKVLSLLLLKASTDDQVVL